MHTYYHHPSLFYHAIALGCVPVVISDWFVFSFPWIGQGSYHYLIPVLHYI